MDSISGKKIFLLYPDEALRAVFHGELRNSFTIYFMYDYEKIRSLAAYYPGSIIVLNLINNDLDWLPEELDSELSGMKEEPPTIIILHDREEPNWSFCSLSIKYNGNNDELRIRLREAFEELGGRGRRNFVRYGGNQENIASIALSAESGIVQGIVHDISASGLSCSFPQNLDIPSKKDFKVKLGLGSESIEIIASKILERKFNDDIIHVLKFSGGMPAVKTEMLLSFIYNSLDSEMKAFAKKLSK